MSKIAISGNDSGSATFTIQSPPTNNNRTFVLPDESGTFLTTSSMPSITDRHFGSATANRVAQ